jgi:hypothetical protein
MNTEIRPTVSSQSVILRVVKVNEPTVFAMLLSQKITEDMNPTTTEGLRD